MVVSIFTFSEANISKYFVSNLFEKILMTLVKNNCLFLERII